MINQAQELIDSAYPVLKLDPIYSEEVQEIKDEWDIEMGTGFGVIMLELSNQSQIKKLDSLAESSIEKQQKRRRKKTTRPNEVLIEVNKPESNEISNKKNKRKNKK